MDEKKIKPGKVAQRISYYLWMTSGIMLLGMFEAFYRDSVQALPQVDLALGGCFRADFEDIDNLTITGDVDLHYSDSTYLPESATVTLTSQNILKDLNPELYFDGECIAKITHPIADAIKYSFIVSILASGAIFIAELLSKKDFLAKMLSTYIWLLAGAITIGVFDAFYRDTLHELPNMDLSMGGCIEAGAGDIPDTLEPGVLTFDYDSNEYPPETVSFNLNPSKEFANYQPLFLFKKECIAKITKPFGRAMEIGFFIGLGLSTAAFLMEQGLRAGCKWRANSGNRDEEIIEHQTLNTLLANEDIKDRCDSDDIELGELRSSTKVLTRT